MELFEQISNDIKDAMKARDKVRLETLRNIKKVFLEAKTAPGANDQLSDESAATFTQSGREDLAAHEIEQVKVIEAYLPKPLSNEEIEKIVANIISETGAQGMKDMGKVMGQASKQMAGKAEGGTISTIVKKLLS